jgi:hypothetical protein
MSWIKAHLKAIVAFAGFVGAGIAGVTSGGIHGVLEWTVVAVALANAVQTLVTPNLADGAARFAKEISAVVLAVAGVLTPAVVAGGLDRGEWWMVIVAILGAFGVVVVPNLGRTRMAVYEKA